MSCKKCELLERALRFYANLQGWRANNGNVLDSICFNDSGFVARRALNEFDKIVAQDSLRGTTFGKKAGRPASSLVQGVAKGVHRAKTKQGARKSKKTKKR